MMMSWFLCQRPPLYAKYKILMQQEYSRPDNDVEGIFFFFNGRRQTFSPMYSSDGEEKSESLDIHTLANQLSVTTTLICRDWVSIYRLKQAGRQWPFVLDSVGFILP